MENYQIKAFRELKIIERALLAGRDARILYKDLRARLNNPKEDIQALQLAMSYLEDYMNKSNIAIPEVPDGPTIEEQEQKLIKEFLTFRAYTYGISADEYCSRFGVEYK